MRIDRPAARGFALAWLAGLGLATSAPAAADDDAVLDQRFEVEPDVRVEVEILSGSIEIVGSDASEVRVHAEGGGGIEVKGSRKRVSLKAPATRWVPWVRGVETELQVEVPRGARVHAQSVNGPISVEGVDGELDLHAANGAIEVSGSPREAFLETMNASIRFEGTGTSQVSARTLNGAVELSGVAGDVEATAVSGSIEVEGERLDRVELRTISGSIELDASLAPRARVEARTYSGAVELRLPPDTSARFDVDSHSGGVESEFVGRLEGEEGSRGAWRQDGDGRLGFVVGDGDARIQIETFSGGVKIEQRDAD